MRNEPIAIVAMAGLYPGARDIEALWQLLVAAEPATAPPGLDDLDIDIAAFRIPPVQRGSMSRMQILMVEAAGQCLADAGYPDRPLPSERTDVVVGTCFGLDRQYKNALRIESARYARELERAAAADHDDRVRRVAGRFTGEFRTRLAHRLGASRHDRVGEMASTIPARIAATFQLLGRTIALESADATSFVALDTAMTNLRAGASDAVLVVTGQRREGSLIEEALAAKGLTTSQDGSFTLSDGVGALLLKRQSTAVADGDRIYASILECVLRHEPHRGAFRYSTTADERYLLAQQCHLASSVDPAAVRYVENVGPGIAAVGAADVKGLGQLLGDAAPASVVFGSAIDRLGHTFANAGLAGVTKAALALYHRTMPPQRAGLADSPGAQFRIASSRESWPAEPESGSRYAAVCGSALGGTLSYLLLEGHPAPRFVTAARSRPAMSAEPIAIVGFGGAFAGSADAASFWANSRSGRGGIGPVPGTVLDRDLYFAPGEITLTHSYSEIGAAMRIPDRPPAALRIPPRRYAAMDPAHRIALSVAGETLTRYGRTAALRDRTGVVAIGSTLCLATERRRAGERSFHELESATADVEAFADLPAAARARILERARRGYAPGAEPLVPADLDGWLASGVAGVIASEYQLRAVPVAVEAACASALAALDLSVSALRTGRVDFALAGGVELACTPRDLVLCSALGLLSHTRITPFDSEADGFSPGDGCALFLLKRHSDAQRDGDEIFGLIRGVGAANDAKSLIAPSVDGQIRAMRAAFAQVDYEPAAVDYLEAHGTGTRVGDRVEIAATAAVYAAPQRARPLVIGSVKALIGHTFAAAGGAGLLHALQAVRAGVFPHNTHLTTINPDLPLHDIPAVLPRASSPWQAESGRPRRAGVSSFGTGGINYHLLLQEDGQD
ncbi:polyketide synthase [Nocardia sp. NBC_00508]|uniref:beta-ketoacyl [acyl carrier protein] synthase domain-containing protein n=1 Tax=Nocardia sp. NBC_00508 TaxID=2975992 RepID=UPI002E802859|nr:polyketide synthase [Nocardia sp. NBC_00508]WUD66753.1 polyketide synthase [Nocardia sp. NBC_00508]